MNWRHGFFRLWIVTSLCWIAMLLVVAGPNGDGFGTREQVIGFFVLALGSPLLTLFVGLVIAWIVAGFRGAAQFARSSS